MRRIPHPRKDKRRMGFGPSSSTRREAEAATREPYAGDRLVLHLDVHRRCEPLRDRNSSRNPNSAASTRWRTRGTRVPRRQRRSSAPPSQPLLSKPGSSSSASSLSAGAAGSGCASASSSSSLHFSSSSSAVTTCSLEPSKNTSTSLRKRGLPRRLPRRGRRIHVAQPLFLMFYGAFGFEFGEHGPHGRITRRIRQLLPDLLGRCLRANGEDDVQDLPFSARQRHGVRPP